MGVESDRLVFDYLSRVGDLAQTAMPAAQRMQLVAQLRNDIDRQRGGTGGDSPAAVRRILGRIGTPDEVVGAASGSTDGSGRGSGGGSGSGSASGAEPPPGSYGPYAKRGPQVPLARSGTDAGRDGSASGSKADPKADPRSGDGSGDGSGTTRGRDRDDLDWWRGSPRGGRPLRAGDELTGLPGMTGGVFIPVDDEELDEKDPPPSDRRARLAGGAGAAEEAAVGPADEGVAEEMPAERQRRPRLPGLRRMRSGWGSPSLLLAALLLCAGAVLQSLIPLGLGWLLAYLSRALSRTQAKFAVLGIPGAAAAGLVVWVWGRDVGKWGKPIAQGQMGHAFQDSYPVAVRLAAVGTALYLLWRSRRNAGG